MHLLLRGFLFLRRIRLACLGLCVACCSFFGTCGGLRLPGSSLFGTRCSICSSGFFRQESRSRGLLRSQCGSLLCRSFIQCPLCIFLGLGQSAQRTSHPVHSCLGPFIPWNEGQCLLKFLVGILPSLPGLRPCGIFHGVVVAHLCAFKIFLQIGQTVQLPVNAPAHVVGVVQVKLNALTSVVEGRNPNGGVQNTGVKPFDVVKKRHVEVKHEPLLQDAFRRA